MDASGAGNRAPRRPSRVIVNLLLIGLAGYAALVGYVFVFQHRLIYLPDAAGGPAPVTPADLGLAYEDVWIEPAGGPRLHGWLVHAQGPETLLFFHGNAGDLTHRLDTIQLFHSLGLSVLIVDYRGYGQSDGRPSEQGTYDDAEAAWNYLTQERGVDPDDIVVVGRSLGGAIATWLAARHEPRGLIIESAFTSVPDMGREVYWFLPVRLISRFEYPTRELIRDVHCPVLVIHSREDEIVPFAHGKAVYEAANEPRTLLELHGGHNDAYLRIEHGAYGEGLRRFLSSLEVGRDAQAPYDG